MHSQADASFKGFRPVTISQRNPRSISHFEQKKTSKDSLEIPGHDACIMHVDDKFVYVTTTSEEEKFQNSTLHLIDRKSLELVSTVRITGVVICVKSVEQKEGDGYVLVSTKNPNKCHLKIYQRHSHLTQIKTFQMFGSSVL
jgi:hypothetical protein